MKLFVIEGGGAGAASTILFEVKSVAPTRDDVKAEAERRVRESGYEDWRVKEFVTGAVMPAALRYLQMQINFVAEAILRLERIPEDFRSDTYWPSL
jgi:hypothetical protein